MGALIHAAASTQAIDSFVDMKLDHSAVSNPFSESGKI